MNLSDAAILANLHMEEHGLTNWTFRWNRRATAAGLCNYAKRTIELSALMTPKREEKDVEDTILHEVAHALAGAGNGHNRTWQLKAIELGARPRTCVSDIAACAVPARYVVICPDHGIVGQRHRRPNPNRVFRHNRCGQVVTWGTR